MITEQQKKENKRWLKIFGGGVVAILFILLIGYGFVSTYEYGKERKRRVVDHEELSTTTCPAEHKNWKEGKTLCYTHCTETIDRKIEDTLYSRTDTIAMGSARVEVYTEWVSSTKDHPIVEINQVYDITHKQAPIHTRHKGEFGGF